MKISITIPRTIQSYKFFSDTVRLYENEDPYVISFPNGIEVICFHFDKYAIPDVVLYEVINNRNMLIFCCYPEFLPDWLRKRHLFPNGKGVCSLIVPTKMDEKSEMIFMCAD